jgi:hypothetical protein
MGHKKHLGRLGESLQTLTDSGGNSTANAAIHLIEDKHGWWTCLRQRNFQREGKSRQFTAGRDLRKRPKRRAFDGGNLECDPLEPI